MQPWGCLYQQAHSPSCCLVAASISAVFSAHVCAAVALSAAHFDCAASIFAHQLASAARNLVDQDLQQAMTCTNEHTSQQLNKDRGYAD